mmetsp:Transcript_54221/g.129196  ORF Transcript_54221/g.129196 Transcript_54221/m.129196 type:complete len:281 (-) Transcript_54221:1017-1859(-)
MVLDVCVVDQAVAVPPAILDFELYNGLPPCPGQNALVLLAVNLFPRNHRSQHYPLLHVRNRNEYAPGTVFGLLEVFHLLSSEPSLDVLGRLGHEREAWRVVADPHRTRHHRVVESDEADRARDDRAAVQVAVHRRVREALDRAEDDRLELRPEVCLGLEHRHRVVQVHLGAIVLLPRIRLACSVGVVVDVLGRWAEEEQVELAGVFLKCEHRFRERVDRSGRHPKRLEVAREKEPQGLVLRLEEHRQRGPLPHLRDDERGNREDVCRVHYLFEHRCEPEN